MTTNSGDPVAVITGAGRPEGIGRAVVDRLLADGYRVVASDLGSALDTHPEYESGSSLGLNDLASDQVLVVDCNVASEKQVSSLFRSAKETFGRVDAAINCAGLGIGLTSAVDLDLADWQVNLDVMATGAFLFAREAARTMLADEIRGSIVTVASQAGKTGMPFLSAYSAAKFAVIGLTQSLASELGPSGIRVNAVCPGTIDTPLLYVSGGVVETYSQKMGLDPEDYLRRLRRQIPLQRMGAPQEVAAAIGYLVSADASFITGEALNVTGGQEMH